MIPTLLPATYVDTLSYSGNVPTFPKHGDVDLVDCIECLVEQTEDESSEWELAMTYPISGQGFSELALDKIILAKANNHQGNQAFRIYGIEKHTKKTVLVKAQHISYDMANEPVKTFKATSASDAVSKLRTNTRFGSDWKNHHFYITTNISSSTAFNPDTPKSMRAMLLDGDDSIKGTYGGDIVFDNYRVQLLQVGGADRGVIIEYGVDLIDMEQEHNNSEMITGILPYYKRLTSDESYATQPIIYGNICYGVGEHEIQRIEPVDLSEHFPNSVPTVSQITAKGREWVANEKIGEPEVSLTVTYANLGQDVRILDAICVRFVKMGVDVKAKVVKYKYNTLLERVEEIEVGHAKDSKYFNLMDASRLKKGLVPPARIANESISSDKIARGGVVKGKIAPEAVGKYEIEKYSIDHDLMSKKGSGGGGAPIQSDNIEDGAVGTDELDDEAVTTGKIKEGAVTTTRVRDSAINESKLGPKAVTNTKLDENAVTTPKINNAAVSWAKLMSGTGQPATKINALETDMAYVNKLFASSAQIDTIRAINIRATNMYATTFSGNISTSSLNVGGNSYSDVYVTDVNGNRRSVLGR